MESTHEIPAKYMEAWIPLLQELVWPFTILLILFFLRKYIPQLLGRTTKIGALGIELEFEKAKEFSSTWSNEFAGDIRTGVKSDDFSSGVMDLMEQFSKEGSYDYAGIDIYGGRAWLTSRLFIFSTILSKARGINYWVFVDSHDSIHKKFIGYIDSRSLRLQLSDHFPFLSKAYTEALLEVFPEGENSLKAADTWQITQLVQQFLKGIQKDYHGVRIQGADRQEIEKGWALLKDKVTLEKARFLDINELRTICGEWILSDAIRNLENTSKENLAAKILLCNERLIPVLNPGNQFVDMVDVAHSKKSLMKNGSLGQNMGG
ncbi:flagellar protein FlgN [Cyclobacterium plantarum]|uniref:Flagellar protein FlgN n=1 Tax=Cyclobacterium plantarum TaxID=2716263 RepID=A0ABX0H9J2_9BACT|nr:flagellar protein FlgN [Cyclobacterium plantarum]NHE58559.1 flagellar protein FlgN [Cyclobacterium plantarum]